MFNGLFKNDDQKKSEEIAKLKLQIEQQRKKIGDLEAMQNESSDVNDLRQALFAARGKLREQSELLKRLTALPLVYATVLSVGRYDGSNYKNFTSGKKVRILQGRGREGEEAEIIESMDRSGNSRVRFADGKELNARRHDFELVDVNDTAVVVFEGQLLEVKAPRGKHIEPGMTVKLAMETKQIVDVVDKLYPGEVAMVRRLVSNGLIEVDYHGNVKTVLKNGETLELGDRVILDSSTSVVVKNMGKENDQFSLKTGLNVRWEDIGGLEKAKKEMIEAIEYPIRYQDIYSRYQKKPIKGVLLWGPPGCGKTMLAKATATAIAKLHDQESVATGFVYIKGPEILDRFVGTAETTIRQIFQRARKHKEIHGYPAVIFIDEADAILGKRGTGISSDIERTIVPMFLAEMDGLEESGAIVLLATNRPDILDPAVVREGRIDRKIKVSRPSQTESRDIFKLYLRGMPLHNGYTIEDLADIVTRDMFSENHSLYEISLNGDHRGQTMKFALGHLASGAMIANIVDQATSLAMQRDIAGNDGKNKKAVKDSKPGGISKDDLEKAVDEAFRQNMGFNHEDDLKDFVYDFHQDVVDIRKLRQSC